MATLAFLWPKKVKFRFPKTQHIRWELGNIGDFTNFIKRLSSWLRLHPHQSITEEALTLIEIL